MRAEPSLFIDWEREVLAAADAPPPRLLHDPATEDAVQALERRIGVRLPPSYRSFLLYSNGADTLPGFGVISREEGSAGPTALLDADRVGWARDLERQLVGIWVFDQVEAADDGEDPRAVHPAFTPPTTERDYLLSAHQSPDLPDRDNPPKPGHLFYALAISVNVDGYQTFLNPLVVDADGEWEALDYGTKTLGGGRYRSFATLIAADTQRNRRWAAKRRDEADESRLSALVTVANDRDLPAADRLRAATELWMGGAVDRAVAVLAELAIRNDLGIDERQKAIQLLAYVPTPEAIAGLVRAAEDPNPRLRAVALPPLASSDDPAAHARAIEILTDPATPDFVIRGTYRGSGPTVWEAYEHTRNPALLPQLAYLGEERAAQALAHAISHPDLDPEPGDNLLPFRTSLLTYASYLPHRAVARALVEAVEREPTWAANVGVNLVRMGFNDLAFPVLRRAILSDVLPEMAARTLGECDDPEAGAMLLELARRLPSSHVLRALAWHPSADAVSLLEAATVSPDVRLASLDALELMSIAEAGDALARRAAAGERLATRALARRRDPRAAEDLMHMLADPDPLIALSGADGLRDLRHPDATGPLLESVRNADPDVAACAAHALICMGSPSAPAGLAALSAHPDSDARSLSASWTAALDAEAAG
jgi:HEAT repeat protein